MKKMKSLFLVFSVVVMLSAFSVMGSRFGYYFVAPAVPGQNTNCIVGFGCLGPSGISYIGNGLIQVSRGSVGSNGLSRYFNALVAGSAFGLAPF